MLQCNLLRTAPHEVMYSTSMHARALSATAELLRLWCRYLIHSLL